MKKLFFGLFFSFCFSLLFSQEGANIPIDETTNLITWQEVVEEDGNTKELYNRCIGWINSYFKNPFNATKVRDPEGGRIVINNSIRLYDYYEDGSKIASNTAVNFILRLEFKENRYRYTFTEFTMRATSKYPLERWLDRKDPTYDIKWESYLPQVEQTINNIIVSMKEGMKAKVVKEDVW